MMHSPMHELTDGQHQLHPGIRQNRARHPGNFGKQYLPMGMWPELSFQEQQKLKRDQRTFHGIQACDRRTISGFDFPDPEFLCSQRDNEVSCIENKQCTTLEGTLQEANLSEHESASVNESPDEKKSISSTASSHCILPS